MSTFVKLIIGVIAFLIYGSTVFYGCGVVDDCLESRKSKIMANLSNQPALAGLNVDTNSCGKVTMSGIVSSQEAKNAAIAACEGCGMNLDSSGVTVQEQVQEQVVAANTNCILKANLNKQGGDLNLSGSIPSEQVKQAILSQAKTEFGSDKVSHQLEDCTLSDADKSKFSSASVAALTQLKNFDSDARFETTASMTQFWGMVKSQSHADAMDQIKNIGSQYHVIYDPVQAPATTPVVQEVVQAPELDKISCQEQVNSLLSNNKIQFTTGKADISSTSDSLLEELQATLAQCENLKVIIEGHTDTRGSKANNQRLSDRRANAVMARLYSLGLTQGRASAIGMGELSPIADESTPEGLAANRRIEFKLQGEL